MNKKNCTIVVVVLLLISSFAIIANAAPAAPTTIPVPRVNISVDGTNTPKDYVDNLKLLVLLTVLTLLPSIIIMMTSFTRIIIVFSFLRSALGTQQAPSNQILIGLTIFLTIFIMKPTYDTMNSKAIQPYLNNTITQAQAIEEGAKPLRQFMLKSVYQQDLKLFIDVAKLPGTIDKNNVPLYVVIPAFVISELKTAFMMGFLIYLPFLVIDLVVASILMSMGMMMLPPVMVSLPFKLLLFVMVDGWHLVVKSLITSFQ